MLSAPCFPRTVLSDTVDSALAWGQAHRERDYKELRVCADAAAATQMGDELMRPHTDT